MFPSWKDFHPVILLPKDYEIYDFTKGYDPNRTLHSTYGIGRYAERRPNMYKGQLFEQEQRCIHMGIDIATPVGEKVYAFCDGRILYTGINPLPFDYGPTIVTEHRIGDRSLYALYGHLAKESLNLSPNTRIHKGQCIARVGSKHENGGWNPHLHFQLSWEKPHTHDLPGVVSRAQFEKALKTFPDPRLVLGPLYT